MSKSYSKSKGRTGTGRFLSIPKQVADSKAYAELGGWSVKLIVDIGKNYNGRNNGDLSAAFSQLQECGWKSKGTLNKAIKELIAHGFIELTRQGGKHKASLYALTWKSIDECDGKLDVKPTKVASNNWKEN